ncbi:DUF6442 family protein [Enterococcus pseudoavium]|uniref:DUF6442 family protein n=1 Tax=Enterococcus pseudoavium TaxID=44007 RepID=A0AAE4L2L1_9ENTE|nr:DUF6442 family protein [Enterococcus pseudoavium]MDT2735889.1 DUF6442 family protein [Enterococcus pseudoavium]MDT2754441.1 DUF6442 family protein [Enterococcus pseudoavium]MDT2769503.1 DUF6442 family protein [Enterococcus pseudoavium]REC26009.1 hypothetical protein CF160_15300 [Enterococcus pseudoavium]REC31008.1 hypothetical protein CF160_00485 [Enterococcus pseudoavium]
MEKNRKQTSTDLAVATAGIFSLILFSVLTLARIVEHREVMDLLSLLTGAAAAFCYGKFLWFNQRSWLVLALILLVSCLFFFVRYLF